MMADEEWAALIREFGLSVRAMRALLGLSQLELARRATTSQGTISRMETGIHFDTPIVSVARVAGVLAMALPAIGPAVPRPHAAFFALGQAFPTAFQPVHSLPPDPELRAFLEAYQRLRPPQRAVLLSLITPLAKFIADVPWRPTPIDLPPPVTNGSSEAGGGPPD